eukprot:scaffold439_cov415-Prasinococcus_capsulatus_cf.AAC.35
MLGMRSKIPPITIHGTTARTTPEAYSTVVSNSLVPPALGKSLCQKSTKRLPTESGKRPRSINQELFKTCHCFEQHTVAYLLEAVAELGVLCRALVAWQPQQAMSVPLTAQGFTHSMDPV